MDYPDLTVSNFMGNSIDLKRVKYNAVTSYICDKRQNLMNWLIHLYVGLDARNPVFGVCQQQRYPCRLINAFFIHFLESIISKLARSEISIF